MTKTPDVPTPAAGGAYVADRKAGTLRRDGHTEQTRVSDTLLPDDTAAASAPAPAVKEPGE